MCIGLNAIVKTTDIVASFSLVKAPGNIVNILQHSLATMHTLSFLNTANWYLVRNTATKVDGISRLP